MRVYKLFRAEKKSLYIQSGYFGVYFKFTPKKQPAGKNAAAFSKSIRKTEPSLVVQNIFATIGFICCIFLAAIPAILFS